MHGTDQAEGSRCFVRAQVEVGGQEGFESRVTSRVGDIREAIRILRVADQAVAPGAGHAHFQGVHSRPRHVRHVDDERRLPGDTQVFPIENNFRHGRDAAQVQHQPFALAQTIRRQLECALIGNGAGEIPDRFVGVLRQRNEFIQREALGHIHVRGEAHFPRAIDLQRGRQSFHLKGARSPIGQRHYVGAHSRNSSFQTPPAAPSQDDCRQRRPGSNGWLLLREIGDFG